MLCALRKPPVVPPSILGERTPKTDRLEVGRDDFRFRWAKGKRNVNTGLGESSGGFPVCGGNGRKSRKRRRESLVVGGERSVTSWR